MRKILAGSVVVAVGLMVAGEAIATVNQLDGTSLPQPTPMAELNVLTSRGFLATDDTLGGLFKIRGETLDPVMSAQQTPGTFSPQCGFTGQIVLKGGDCQNALGWYNVTPGSTTPPAQIYTLVPANLMQAPPNGISCMDNGFCPMAEPSTTQPTQHTWVNYVWNASSIASDPRYKGGQVGFALMANTTGGKCNQTKYSQAELNVISTKYNKPWVTTLVYQSTVDPSSYYLAFEDLPMLPSDWTMSGTGGGCDGDFNDFVFYVTGLNCQGGGVDCDTMMPGVCAGGTTQCSSDGTMVSCKPNIQKSPEKCNGLDDDCDGVVDNPDAPNLCDPGYVCSEGTCIPPCSDTEFPCTPPLLCDKTDHLCKDPLCIGKVCGAEQTCYEGTCIGGCDGVKCPPNQVCRIGQCVDPCQGVTCPDTQVCDNGACVSPCSCRPCAAGQTCTSKGTCVDMGCDKVTCNAPQVCVGGKCQDGCQGTVCPTGQLCMNGQCSTPASGPVVPIPDGGASTGAGGFVTSTGGISGTGGQVGSGGSNGLGGNSGLGGSGTGGASGAHAGGLQTCSCDESGGPHAGGLALMLAALALLRSRRRQRAG